MRKYIQLYSLFSLVFLCVHSQLQPNQINTMKNLHEMLKNNTSIVSWNLNKDPCSWKGVSCTFSLNQSSITQLSFSSFSLSTVDFLPVMCHISTLEAVDLSNNSLSSIPDGFITGCGKIIGLKTLNISMNMLVGNLPSFFGFENLERLDLSENSLNGSIGIQLSGLSSLRYLNLGFNNFTGSVPFNFGKLFVLEELYLSINKFNGKIPEDIANYSNLVTLDLSANMLSGIIPDQFAKLSKLETFVLSSNSLSGEIPEFLSSINTLKRFAANMNHFSGILPSGLTNSLVNLDLSFNSLNGSIPFDFLSQPNLQTVDLSVNLLTGSIPEIISPRVVRLRLGTNNLSGKIPSSSFGNNPNLTYLELENNNLEGSIPQGLGMCTNLALLNLANNKLTGFLPLDFGNLTHLQELKLQSNNFIGEIPIPITNLQELRKVNLCRNYLNGSIPWSISNWLNLTNLDLSRNNLSGSIPDSISNIRFLIELELGENRLSGKIPLMPQNLQTALNLSGNLFQGTMPKTLSNLRQLEVLDLSRNNFSGQIPSFFSSMMSLTTLNLSNNSLTGYVPAWPPYLSVDISGNKGLIIPKRGPASKVNRKKKTLTKGIVISIVVAVVVAAGIVTLVAIFVPKCYRKTNERQIESHEDFSQLKIIHGAILTRNPLHRSNIDFAKAMELVIDPSNIFIKTKFSTFYKAVMPSGLSYFVKKFEMFQSGSHDKFADEMQVLSKLSNTNIMAPLGYILTVDSAYIFYEYSRMGTLFDGLHNQNMGKPLDWASRYSIVIGVAQGLAYLHEHISGPILLLDLSSTSVLLRSHKEPKIGDIELWKVIDPMKNTTSLSAVAGSVGYIPPEYAYTMRMTVAGNIYSLGVIFLELLTGRPAMSEGIALAKWPPLISPEKQKYLDYILDDSISRTSLAVKNQMVGVLKVALACIQDSPGARPNAKTIVKMLQNLR